MMHIIQDREWLPRQKRSPSFTESKRAIWRRQLQKSLNSYIYELMFKCGWDTDTYWHDTANCEQFSWIWPHRKQIKDLSPLWPQLTSLTANLEVASSRQYTEDKWSRELGLDGVLSIELGSLASRISRYSSQDRCKLISGPRGWPLGEIRTISDNMWPL